MSLAIADRGREGGKRSRLFSQTRRRNDVTRTTGDRPSRFECHFVACCATFCRLYVISRAPVVCANETETDRGREKKPNNRYRWREGRCTTGAGHASARIKSWEYSAPPSAIYEFEENQTCLYVCARACVLCVFHVVYSMYALDSM